jgi:hypothetical protein
MQRVFIVQQYLTLRSYLNCQNGFSDKFSDIPVPEKLTVSREVNSFRDRGSVQDRCLSNVVKSVNAYFAELDEHFYRT